MFKLGMMDPMEDQTYVKYGAAEVDNAKAREVALRSATESIVLLKNTGAVLPLTAVGKKFAFIGPHANSTQHLMGSPGYHGVRSSYFCVILHWFVNVYCKVYLGRKLNAQPMAKVLVIL